MNLESIIDALLDTPYAKRQGDEYVYVRCPICGDNPRTRNPHCSVWIKPNQPLIYHCWICTESGLVDNTFLSDLGIGDVETVSQVAIYNKATTAKRKDSHTFHKEGKERNIVIPEITGNDMARWKLQYMRDRMGINFTFKSMEALRVVFNLEDFLKVNKLKPNPKYEKMIYFLNRDYIGFLTSGKETLVMRNINPEGKMRYVKYPLYNEEVLSNQAYVMPAQVDIMSPEVHLHIAEGVFDIYGAFFHIMKGETRNSIYAAVGGSGYAKIIQYFIRQGFMTNLIVHIYSDQDKKVPFYKELIRKYRGWVKEFHIYYNELSKDIGVRANEIKLVEARL